jgi:hypothetical protein
LSKGQLDPDHGSFSFTGSNVHYAADRSDPFPHTDQADALFIYKQLASREILDYIDIKIKNQNQRKK